MISNHGWPRYASLLAVALCVAGSAWAQEVAPAESTAAAPAPAMAVPPQAATPAPRPADSSPAKSDDVQPASTPSASTAATNPGSEGELDADKIIAAQRAGYKIKNENGQTLLCRRDKQTGSHTRYRTSCLTAREWEQLRSDNEQVLKAIERRPRMTNQ